MLRNGVRSTMIKMTVSLKLDFLKEMLVHENQIQNTLTLPVGSEFLLTLYHYILSITSILYPP